ncbi:MAG: GMP synthase-like glutamine amidotransferase [Flammeovirgaceae bacterium]|jgi:homoserine O-succinyltransferase
MGNSGVRVAVMDMNNNVNNQGLGHICRLLERSNLKYANQAVDFKVYDIRHKVEIPTSDYDIYISTGGPGNPFDGEGKQWEIEYFQLIEKLWNHNQNTSGKKKYVFFICHSFQLAVRFFDLATITKRQSMSFGVYPSHRAPAGEEDIILKGLGNPFWIADFRDYQATEPNHKKFNELGAKIICLEKIRPHIDLERAILGIRLSEEMVATQFHPEADAKGMLIHFKQPERMEHVIKVHGEEKYHQFIEQLEDADKISATFATILPNFLKEAILVSSGVDKEMILF